MTSKICGKFITLALLIFTLINISCNNEKLVFLKTEDLASAVDSARHLNKGLILISGMVDCSMCERFEADLIRDENFEQTIAKEYVIQRINSDVVGFKWLSRLLNSSGVPVYLFLNRGMEFRGVKTGAFSKEQYYEITKIYKDSPFIDPNFRFGENNLLTTNKIPEFLTNLIFLQLNNDRLLADNNRNIDFELLKSKINSNNEIYNSFYGNYLISKIAHIKNDTISLVKYSSLALQDTDAVNLYFNNDLRADLKSKAFKNYEKLDDPFISVENQTINIGKLEQNEVRNFPLTIRNIGRKQLVLDNIVSSCGCTLAKFDKKNINPGDSLDIEISINPNTGGGFNQFLILKGNAVNSPMQINLIGSVH